MNRPDAIGLFWQDVAQVKGNRVTHRIQPDIPPTGWVAPRDFPRLDSAPYLVIDKETKDLNLKTHGPGWARNDGHIVGIGVGVEGKAWYFPMRHEVKPEENLDPVHVEAWFKDTMSKHGKKPIIGANLLYDFGWMSELGIYPQGIAYDVQFAEALLEEAALTNLDNLTKKYLEEQKDEDTHGHYKRYEGHGKPAGLLYQWCADYYGGKPDGKQRENIYRSPPSLVGPYAEGDVTLPARILPLQWERLQREGLVEIFEMECRLIPLLIQMRRHGVRVDLARAEYVNSAMKDNIKLLNGQLKEMVGFEVNVDANESLQKAFKALNLPIPMAPNDKGIMRPSFTKDTLALVEHPVADHILIMRKREKVRSTFIESYILKKHVNGLIHASFHPLRGDQGGTRSGRIASSQPNLTNVPSRDEELAPLVRSCFIPHIGHKQWRRYDQDQIEYRYLANYAVGPKSDEIRARYNTNPDTDYHVETQQMVAKFTGIEIPRKPIKNFNFGMTFGMGKAKMVRSTMTELKKISKDFTLNGDQLYEAYHEAVPFTKATLDYYSSLAQAVGYVTTILGRRSRFDLWEPMDTRGETREPALPYYAAMNKYGIIKRAYTHKALNRVLQGSGTGDHMKKAMLNLWDSGVLSVVGIPGITVYDELDFSDAGGNEEAWAYVKRIMETAIKIRIPVRTKLDIGANWGEAS